MLNKRWSKSNGRAYSLALACGAEVPRKRVIQSNIRLPSTTYARCALQERYGSKKGRLLTSTNVLIKLAFLALDGKSSVKARVENAEGVLRRNSTVPILPRNRGREIKAIDQVHDQRGKTRGQGMFLKHLEYLKLTFLGRWGQRRMGIAAAAQVCCEDVGCER